MTAAEHAITNLYGANRELDDQSREILPAAVWLAEIGVFADSTPALSKADLLDAIRQQWPQSRIAHEHAVSITRVKIELHRHGLFEAHRLRHRNPGSA